jgi:uncharacterized protein (DUF1499 family)
MGWLSGRRPTDLGVRDGRLKPVPTSPNAVSSQAAADDRGHWIAPLRHRGARDTVLSGLAAIVRGQPRTSVVAQTADYLHAEFTSALMGFVDDVEFWLPPTEPGVIHVRSASRLGHSDLGANRARIETLRALVDAKGL